MPYDIVIVGGGPAGLSAALALGRGRKRVLLCDGGPRRNAAALHLHNFVTRDGTPPEEFRRIAREQLAAYPSVEVRDTNAAAIIGSKGAFTVTVGTEQVETRRVLLCTGMVDELLPIEGFRELWGHSVFQCPYCHGWEIRERPWAYLARDGMAVHFAFLLRSWSEHVTLFTQGAFELDAQVRAHLDAAGIRVEHAPIARLRRAGHRLEAIELANGEAVPCEALFAHPPQRQVGVVASLGLTLDADGFVQVDPMSRETSRPGIYAAGDLTTRLQGAVFAASSGAHAAGMLNHELTVELAMSGGAHRR